MADRTPYRAPELRAWGKVTEVTRTGYTNPGGDMKHGSRPSQGH